MDPPILPRPRCVKLLLGCAGLSCPLGNSVSRVLANSRMRWLLFVGLLGRLVWGWAIASSYWVGVITGLASSY